MVKRLKDLLVNLDIKDKFVCGDKMSIADFCLAALYLEVMEMNQPALKQAFADHQPLKPYFTAIETEFNV